MSVLLAVTVAVVVVVYPVVSTRSIMCDVGHGQTVVELRFDEDPGRATDEAAATARVGENDGRECRV